MAKFEMVTAYIYRELSIAISNFIINLHACLGAPGDQEKSIAYRRLSDQI